MKNNPPFKFYQLYLTGIFLILTLPLLSAPPLFHPAPWGKSIVFRITFSILLFLFIYEILFLKNPAFFATIKEIKRQNPLFFPFWLLIALFTIFLLATIFSLNPHFSFWGSPYRGGGFLTLGMIMTFAVFLFLIVKKKDWQKIIDFSIGIGAFTAVIAIFQKFGLFSKYMTSYRWRPVSTMGGSIFFALFLILLIFLTLAFATAAKGKKKIFYLSSFTLLLLGIILAASRAVFLGFFVGLLFFIFAYPKKINNKNNQKIFWLKISTAVFIILGIIGILGLKTQPQIVNILKQNTIFGTTFNRIWSIIENPSIKTFLGSRGSGWKVAIKAVKSRPLLGYGPENFSIGFDKFYDPNLPGIKKQPGESATGWWDRGHSFIFDISVSAGVPALIIYLLLFIALFYQLQKIKKTNQNKEKNIEQECKTNQIISHGLQTTFIAYLTADLFSFDVFSTYLMLFLIIAYSFHLIWLNNNKKKTENEFSIKQKNSQRFKEPGPGKYIFILILFFILLWFIWSGNLKPLFINKKINQYVFLSEKIYSSRYTNPTLAKKQEEALLKKMDELLTQRSIIDNYLRLQYIDIIAKAAALLPEKNSEISLKAIKILRECQKLRPHYTRAWFYNVVYINKYLESTPNPDPKFKEKLNKEAIFDIKKAKELSPKKPDIFLTSAANYLINKNYQKAEKEADQCIKIAPDNKDCWWAKSLSLIGMEKIDEATKAMDIASQKGYKAETKNAIGQLINMYSRLAKKTKRKTYYQKLEILYQKLIEIDKKEIKELEKTKKIKKKENFQYHASLAYIYKILGKYDKARKEAEIVMKLSPASKKNVEIFLKTLPPTK